MSPLRLLLIPALVTTAAAAPPRIDDLRVSDSSDPSEPTVRWTRPDGTLQTHVRAVPIAAAASGTGADGPLLLFGGTTTVDDVRAPVLADLPAGATTIPVTSSAGFSVGDEIILVDAQGQHAGRYAFRGVVAVGPSELIVDVPLGRAFPGLLDRIFVQRVPQYTTVDVFTGATLTAHPWDGETGGLVVLRASDLVTIHPGATVTATGLGLRGGGEAAIACDAPITAGEGALAPGLRGGAPAFAPAGCGDGTGGGGGGHAEAGEPGEGPGCATGPAGGQAIGTDSLGPLLMGAGGAAGHAASARAGQGGRGGGVIWIAGPEVLVLGTLEAAGLPGADGCAGCDGCGGSCAAGGGGGGAGGSIRLAGDTVDVAGTLTLSGGAGGAHAGCGGNGGAGAPGRLRVDALTVGGVAAGYQGEAPLFAWHRAQPWRRVPSPRPVPRCSPRRSASPERCSSPPGPSTATPRGRSRTSCATTRPAVPPSISPPPSRPARRGSSPTR